MDSIKLRPRCKFEFTKSVSQIMDGFIKKMREPHKYVEGSTLMNHAYLKIKPDLQHYWSPEIHITVEETSTGTLVRAVAGPKPKIWTMFMFFYSAVVVLFLFGSALGVSQWSLGMKAPWLWSIPASLVAWLGILGAAKYGQWKGKRQLRILYDFMNDVLNQED